MNVKCGGYDRKLIFVPYNQSKTDLAQINSDLGNSLQRSAFEIPLFCHLWDQIFRQDATTRRPMGAALAENEKSVLHMLGWTMSVEDMYPQRPMVKSALLAVSLAVYGRHYKRQDIVVEGLHHYSMALAQLSSALRDEKRKISDEVLATCKLFVVYEWFGFGSSEGVTKLAQNWFVFLRRAASFCY